MLHKYIYEGPVFKFDFLVVRNFKTETMAPTIAKARSNFKHQVKKLLGLMPNARVELPGRITIDQ